MREQYELARLATHDKEDHWLAVEKYFPPEKSAENRRYTRLARRGRANLYVAERRLPEALKLYEQLANVEDSETDLQLSGIAGRGRRLSPLHAKRAGSAGSRMARRASDRAADAGCEAKRTSISGSAGFWPRKCGS